MNEAQNKQVINVAAKILHVSSLRDYHPKILINACLFLAICVTRWLGYHRREAVVVLAKRLEEISEDSYYEGAYRASDKNPERESEINHHYTH